MCVAARRWPSIVGDVAVTDTTGAAVDTSEFFGPDEDADEADSVTRADRPGES